MGDRLSSRLGMKGISGLCFCGQTLISSSALLVSLMALRLRHVYQKTFWPCFEGDSHAFTINCLHFVIIYNESVISYDNTYAKTCELWSCWYSLSEFIGRDSSYNRSFTVSKTSLALCLRFMRIKSSIYIIRRTLDKAKYHHWIQITRTFSLAHLNVTECSRNINFWKVKYLR